MVITLQEITLEPALYLVATPIGNMRDITLRAIDILTHVDYIYCEDTRVSRKLMQKLGIKKSLRSYHDHSDAKIRQDIADLLKNNQSVALISDAGMPCISDPGYKLVRLCRENDLTVFPVPGANAPLAALSASGLPTDQFYFCGFLPVKAKARQEVLAMVKDLPATIIIFESGRKLRKTLQAIEETMGDRYIVIAREITKKFEEYTNGYADKLISKINDGWVPKGEIVLLISPNKNTDIIIDETNLEKILSEKLAKLSLKDAVDTVVQETGIKRKKIYAQALKIKKNLSQ